MRRRTGPDPHRVVRRLFTAVVAIGASVGVLVAPVAATAPPAAPSDGDITMASINLSFFMIQNLDAATSGTIAAPCPLLTQEAMNAQLAARGLTPSNDGYAVDAFYDDDIETAKVTCGVDVVDVFDDPDPADPHGVTIDGGEIGGSCVDDGVSGLCYLFWHRNELVLSVALAGPEVDVTQDASVQLLTDIVPLAVASLVAYHGSPETTTTLAPVTTVAPVTTAPAVRVAPAPTVALDPTATTVYVKPQPGASTATTATTAAVGPTPTTAPGAEGAGIAALVSAATAALDGYLALNPIGTEGTPEGGVPCPVVDAAGLAGAMTAQGLDPNMAGFEVSVLERTDWVAGLAYVNCGVGPAGALGGADPAAPPHYASIEVYDITGVFTWDQVVATLSGDTSDVDPATGGDIVSGCTTEFEGSVFCGGLWHLDDLVVRVSLVGPVASVSGPVVEQLTLALAPTAVANLAHGTFIAG